jgi:hypothetical protein
MITVQQLKKRLHYDPETGIFTWLNGQRKGQPAGSKNGRGYLEIRPSVDGSRKRYKAHRLAWLYIFGQWSSEIDHINGDPLDNRIGKVLLFSRLFRHQRRGRCCLSGRCRHSAPRIPQEGVIVNHRFEKLHVEHLWNNFRASW